jgi:hypothetical protein
LVIGTRSRRRALAASRAVLVLALVSSASACGDGGSGSSAPSGLYLQRIVRSVRCGAPQALVDDPFKPGRCVALGDVQLGPKDFVHPVVEQDPARGSGVGLTLTKAAAALFRREIASLVPGAPSAPGSGLTFVFDGRPLRWTLLPGPDTRVFVVTPDDTVAQRIVASLQSQ